MPRDPGRLTALGPQCQFQTPSCPSHGSGAHSGSPVPPTPTASASLSWSRQDTEREAGAEGLLLIMRAALPTSLPQAPAQNWAPLNHSTCFGFRGLLQALPTPHGSLGQFAAVLGPLSYSGSAWGVRGAGTGSSAAVPSCKLKLATLHRQNGSFRVKKAPYFYSFTMGKQQTAFANSKGSEMVT